MPISATRPATRSINPRLDGRSSKEILMSESIVIVGAARTPMGGFQGDFSALAAHDLGGDRKSVV